MSARRKQTNWTQERVDILCKMYGEGQPDRVIVRALGGDISVAAIKHKRTRLGLVADKRIATAKFRRDHEKAARDEIARMSADSSPIAASIYHLIDLKRAGHSPTRTEYRIGSDGLPRRYRASTERVYSSPAGTCAEA